MYIAKNIKFKKSINKSKNIKKVKKQFVLYFLIFQNIIDRLKIETDNEKYLTKS